MNKYLILIASLLMVIVIYVGNNLIAPSDSEVKALGIISDCWKEEEKICKEEEKGDACSSGVGKTCSAKHPEMTQIFKKRADTCSKRHGGSLIDNPAVWKCAGAED
jgi:hypothetical protein